MLGENSFQLLVLILFWRFALAPRMEIVLDFIAKIK